MVDIWEDNTTNEWGLPVCDLGSVSDSATIESASCQDLAARSFASGIISLIQKSAPDEPTPRP
jgi:hypothetical protein